jgi:GDP-L-fucose synthase
VILVTGATGFLGKRVCRRLDLAGLPYVRSSISLGTDLRNAAETLKLFEDVRPTDVLNCAAFVGGIRFGYDRPADLFHNNLLMATSLLSAGSATKVRRIVNPISNCAYPGKSTLFRESEFWDGPMHESVLAYGFARKAFWVGSWAYNKQYGLDVVNLILSNMYGPDDHFEEARSHALGALIMKIVDAKRSGAPRVTVWGSGTPVREWLHVDDGAEAMFRALAAPPSVEPVNIGVGKGISVIDMARLIARIAGYEGRLVLDPSMPDGAPYKTVDGSRGEAYLEWRPTHELESGIAETVKWYMENFSGHQ